MATGKASNHEMDTLIMTLERLNASVPKGQRAIAIVARPSGGRSDEDNFLADCVEVVTGGTHYSSFDKLATNVFTMPFSNSRILQIADIVVSATTAKIAGYERFLDPIFNDIKYILRSNNGCFGGPELKIHPDFVYANLYHWILGDQYYSENGIISKYPIKGRPYYKNANEYK